MAGNPNTILLGPADERLGSQGVREALADAAMTPGHLLERTATGVKVHATSNGRAQKLFALENVADASGIDDAYAVGETARFLNARTGDKIYALVPAAAPAIVVGDGLASNGDGTLVKVTDTAGVTPLDEIVVAYAIEAVDNSGGGSAVRIQVEAA